jgi:uncharacterized protein Smg (DUF494 family)
MKPKIIEVITKILEGLSNNIAMEDLNISLLKNKGYDEQTLGIAFSLIYDKMLIKKRDSKQFEKVNRSVRILTEEEKEMLGMDNYNYVLHLVNLGLLDSANLESILEQVTYYPENRLTRKEINWIILISLVDFDSEIPPGSRLHLYSTDPVN